MPNNYRWSTQGIEPDLHDLLADPIVQLVLRRDGLVVSDVWVAVSEARSRLRRLRRTEIGNAA